MSTYHPTLKAPEIARELRKKDGEFWLTDKQGQRGKGSIRLRVKNGTALVYFRYATQRNGKLTQVQLPIGKLSQTDFDAKNYQAWDEAVEKAVEYSNLYQQGHDVDAYLKQEEADKAKQEAKEQAEREQAERLASKGTLAALLMGYVQHLRAKAERKVKSIEGLAPNFNTATQVKNLFERDVIAVFPDLADKLARDITHDDINTILRRLVDADHEPAARKMRAYMHAAFKATMQFRFNATIHSAMGGFDMTANPVALLDPKAFATHTGAKRPLNEHELRCVLAELKEQPGLVSDAILACLYLGGQRPLQLLRLRPVDIDLVEGTLTLYDSKGARTAPRVHVLPLFGPAREIVERRMQDGHAYVFSRGDTPLRSEELSRAMTAISDHMLEDGRTKKPFFMKNLRATVETQFSKMGISKDVKKHVLSHGFGGVQDKSYDAYEYMAEKRAALEAWARELQRIESGEAQTNVVALRA